MKNYNLIVFLSAFLLTATSISVQAGDIEAVRTQIANAMGKGTPEAPAVVNVAKSEYLLDADVLSDEELYISNTDLTNPKKVGLAIRGLKNAVVDFHNSELKTRGRVIALVVEDCENLTLKNFHIDSDSPAMVQVEVLKNDENGLVLKPADYCPASVNESGSVVFTGDGWQATPLIGLAFDGKTKHTLYNVADIASNFDGAKVEANGVVVCPNWKDGRFPVGSVLVLRVDTFNLCGFFINNCSNVVAENIQIHYAPAKAVVAQRSENLTFDRVSINLRGSLDPNFNDPRYFTANADAIHCSCCKGKILVENGLYEGMMDDAINVHGIYVKTFKKFDERTVEIHFMHSAASGFEWAKPGDEIAFLRASSMESFEDPSGKGFVPTAKVESIEALDRPTAFGANRFKLTFCDSIPDGVTIDENCALENITQTPEVIYRNNVVRNNRARGALFSTFKPVLIENNLFDHVSGTALLFCGDANGWYESGPCKNVVIRKNRFINCMTAFYQFCEAPISIYPEIPDFGNQRQYYDGGTEDSFVIEDNEFQTFDSPILYARSVDGVVFQNNKIRHNKDFAPIASNKKPFVFDNANRIRIYDNDDDSSFDPQQDVDSRRVPNNGVVFSKKDSFAR